MAQIVKAIGLLRHDGYVQEADIAQKYLLPMLEGVTFNDVWGDADIAGASILDYYVPNATDSNFGFGAGFLSWDIFSPNPYKNSTQSFKDAPLSTATRTRPRKRNIATTTPKRIYLHHWSDDQRDSMAGLGGGPPISARMIPRSGDYAVGTAADQ